jgi:hypothetical protein
MIDLIIANANAIPFASSISSSRAQVVKVLKTCHCENICDSTLQLHTDTEISDQVSRYLMIYGVKLFQLRA